MDIVGGSGGAGGGTMSSINGNGNSNSGNGPATISGEYKNFNEFLEELGDNALLQTSFMPHGVEQQEHQQQQRPQIQEINIENMPPLLYFLLIQKLKQSKFLIEYFMLKDFYDRFEANKKCRALFALH